MTKILGVSLPNENCNGHFITSDMPNTLLLFTLEKGQVKIIDEIAYISGVKIPLILSPYKQKNYEGLLNNLVREIIKGSLTV